MSIDAIAVLRPRDPAVLEPYLDLDEDSEESEGLYAEALDDGSFLVHTFQEYALFAEDAGAGQEWLAQFGEDVGDIHDDPRGILFFPDSIEPEGQTYEAVVAEVGEQGVWVSMAALVPAEVEGEGSALPFAAAGMAGMGLREVADLAQQLLSSFDLGALISAEDPTKALAEMQRKIGAQFGASGAFAEFADDAEEGDAEEGDAGEGRYDDEFPSDDEFPGDDEDEGSGKPGGR
ncbi:hypothetical protein [Chondromyces crocatus]|uniref:Uncharacterized protein n=1 Tax=Chondromyces crocatus TaxID=52 RepID=A0A0K1EQU1_CHOCO|nr:hypothetical protein [Chondromyces crocatus]AKT43295.1 uncharacterized protein CMC5_075270 [Chondromyces crocatus]